VEPPTNPCSQEKTRFFAKNFCPILPKIKMTFSQEKKSPRQNENNHEKEGVYISPADYIGWGGGVKTTPHWTAEFE